MQPSDSQPRYLFGKAQRLLRGAEFDAVFAEKLSSGDGMLLIYGRPNGLGHARLGLVVSRKVGKAVRRNSWKRTLREAFRLAQHELPPLDFVCLPRSPDKPTMQAIQGSLCRLAARIDAKAQRRNESRGGEP